MIAFLGMGLLGANFVKALRRNGEAVNVWNRTATKAQALEPFGATAYAEITEAVANADRVHLTLKDDAAVDEVLELAWPGLMHGALIIDHTTTSAQGAVERTALWQQRGYTYMHVPVFMGPQNALDATGTMLVSGNADVIAQVEPLIATMTGKIVNFGPEPGRAASMKLIGNLFLIAMTGGLSDVLGLATASSVPLTDVFALFNAWNPVAMVPARLQKMTSNTFDQPTWELNMARKDARLMLEASEASGIALTVIPAIAAEMDKWIAQGHGAQDWTVFSSGHKVQ